MKCGKCEAEMFQAKITSAPAEIMLTNKKPGFFETEKRSRVLCYVCPECGHIELAAENPKGLQIESISVYYKNANPELSRATEDCATVNWNPGACNRCLPPLASKALRPRRAWNWREQFTGAAGEFRPCGDSQGALPPGPPPPLKRWTKLLSALRARFPTHDSHSQ